MDEFGNIILSDYYCSNCLIEALKAKAKNPETKIQAKTYTMHGITYHHFTWTIPGDTDYCYDFGTNMNICAPILFKGYLRKRSIGTANK